MTSIFVVLFFFHFFFVVVVMMVSMTVDIAALVILVIFIFVFSRVHIIVADFLVVFVSPRMQLFLITFLFMASLIRFVDPQPWKRVIGWALVGSVGSYLIFEVWMKLRLPKGFLGV